LREGDDVRGIQADHPARNVPALAGAGTSAAERLPAKNENPSMISRIVLKERVIGIA